MNKIYLYTISALFLTLSLSGCVEVKTGNETQDRSGVDGGIIKTINKGDVWQQKVLIPTVTGKPGNFSGANVAALEMDPSDNQAIYYGGIGAGLLYSYDGGASWQVVNPLKGKTVRAVAVDPKDKCTVYVGIGNQVHKTVDCSRTWQQVYYDGELAVAVDAISIDQYNPNILYIGVSRGDIIKSSDGGTNWQVLGRFGSRIKRIVMNPKDSRSIFVATYKNGIYFSNDGGAKWEQMVELHKVLKDEKLGLNVKDFVFLNDEVGTMFVATFNGLMKSVDGGATWQKITLILPEQKASVNAFAANPTNAKEIYYVTNTTFYRSLDGGTSWTPVKIPSTRSGQALLVDPKNPGVIYMGLQALEKK